MYDRPNYSTFFIPRFVATHIVNILRISWHKITSNDGKHVEKYDPPGVAVCLLYVACWGSVKWRISITDDITSPRVTTAVYIYM